MPNKVKNSKILQKSKMFALFGMKLKTMVKTGKNEKTQQLNECFLGQLNILKVTFRILIFSSLF